MHKLLDFNQKWTPSLALTLLVLLQVTVRTSSSYDPGSMLKPTSSFKRSSKQPWKKSKDFRFQNDQPIKPSESAQAWLPPPTGASASQSKTPTTATTNMPPASSTTVTSPSQSSTAMSWCSLPSKSRRMIRFSAIHALRGIFPTFSVTGS